jgi:Tfp pilus assembly protein PilF
LAELARGQAEAALVLLTRLATLAPALAQAQFALGNTLHTLGRHAESIVHFDRAIAAEPGNHAYHFNRATVLQAMREPQAALAGFDTALALQPDDTDALINRGAVLLEMQRYDEALASYDRALELEPAAAKGLYNRGLALQRLRRPADALAAFDQALAVQPDYPEALTNRGAVLADLGRIAEAHASYAQVLRIRPDSAKAHWNQSLLYLLDGDFARGWPLHEARWDALNPADRQYFSQPQWTGAESLSGRTILVHCEQGLGDTLQFCRYAPLLSASGATVLLQVQAPLKTLLTQLPDVQVLARGEPVPHFDCQIPLLSLPLALRTELATIPARVPYLHADRELALLWRQRLDAGRPPRIGLAWSGNARHGNDHNRSLPLTELVRTLAPLAGRASFVSLQKEVRAADEPVLRASGIRHFGAELADFRDTAALADSLDLIVSVDTSVAHLAGALGRPLWILLPFTPDWRWLRERADSPWYPTARLLRQRAPGDWDAALAELAHGLAACIAKTETTHP